MNFICFFRYGTAIALGIAYANSFNKDAIDILLKMLNDP